VGTTLNIGLVIAEATFGLLSNSIALVADGVHNFSDVLGLLLAWGGSFLAKREAERFAGLRLKTQPVASGTVPWVAAAAILVNLEQVPEKLTDFFDQNLLNHTDLARFLIDRKAR